MRLAEKELRNDRVDAWASVKSIPASVLGGIPTTWEPWAILPSEVTVTGHHHNSNKANRVTNWMQTLDAVVAVLKEGMWCPLKRLMAPRNTNRPHFLFSSLE